MLFQGHLESLSGSQAGTHSLHPLLLSGKPYGADDFLPVLMYVLARSNLTEMLLDVEYMMELMDPALQLGEGEFATTPTPTTIFRQPKAHPLPRQVAWRGLLR